VPVRLVAAWIMFASAMVLLAGSGAAGEDGAAEQPAQTIARTSPALDRNEALRFQRVLVPADRPEDWPRQKGARYLPMPTGEFDRRTRQLGSGLPTGQTARSHLIRAEYSARLQGDALVDGVARWEFTHTGEPEVLVLGHCELPLSDFQWKLDSSPNGVSIGQDQAGRSAPPSDSHAVVGNDEMGRLAARVDRVGTMHGLWSRVGARQSDGALTFALRLPACSVNVLRLTLPAGLELSADRGQLGAPTGHTPSEQTWLVQLGGYQEVNLRIGPRVEESHRQRAVRESHQFSISERGIELSSEFQLESDGLAAHRITLLMESPLRLVAARWNNDTNLDIEDARGAEVADRSGLSEVTLNLPVQFHGEGVLQVQAIAPWQLEMRSRLPLVHVAGARWEQGRARLVIPHHLEFQQLLLRDCQQTAADLAVDADSDALDIQFYSDHPAIDVAIARHKEQIDVVQGTSVLLRANEGAARCVAVLSSEDGERFVAEAEVAPKWIIDRVESVPDGLVADWSQHSGQGLPGKLTVQLSEPIAPDQEVELLISARRRSAPEDDKFYRDDLAMLRFLNIASARRIVDVQTTEANQLQIRGADELNRLDPAQLSEEDAGLFMDYPGGLSFVADDGARELSVSLVTKDAVFDADIHGQFIATDESFTESYRFAITPHGRDLRHFTVRFSQPRPEAIDWSIDEEPEAVLSARRISAAELAASGLAGGEVWEVSLPLARQTPFVVIANRTTALHDSMPLALASIIQAETQHGTVQIHSLGRNLPEVISNRPAIPVEVPASGQFPTALAAFRYAPDEDALLSAVPPLVLALHPDTPKPAWIWEANLASRYLQHGCEHVLTCRVENAGRQRIQFQAPPGAQWRGAWIDDQPLANSPDNDRWRMNLPAGKRLCTVVIRWTDAIATNGLAARRLAAWPDCDVPILNRTWIIQLPPNKSLANADISGMHVIFVPWTKRLFGPLGGSSAILQSDAPNLPTGNGPSMRNPTPLSSESASGWSSYRFDGIGSTDSAVWIADEQTVSAWAWTLFLLAAVIRWFVGRRTTAVEIAIFGIATSLALLVPAHWVPLSAGIWLGLAAGRLALQAALWFPEKLSPQKTSSKSQSGTTLKAATASVCFLLLTVARGLLRADEAAEEQAKPRAGYRVLVPSDSQGRPIGDLVYLPEEFYSLLEKATPDAARSLPAYVITGARYRAGETAEAARSEKRDNPDADGNWQADLEIESFDAHIIAKLPLGLSGAALIPDGVQLDGRQAPIRLDDTQHFVCLELEHAGRHRVAIAFRPIKIRDQFDFEVPIVSAAQIELSGLADPSTRIASALGATQREVDSGASVWLGPANRIILQHAAPAAQPTQDSPKFDVAEMYWLRIRPGSVGLDARFHVNVHSGRLDRLRLTIDPRLKPVSAPGAGAQPRVDPNDPRTVELDLSHSISGQGTIDARFAYNGASGIGCWRPPIVEIQGAAKSRKSWSASIDPSMLYEQRLATGEIRMPAADFASQWPSADAQPQLAWKSLSGSTETAIFTRPRDSKATARYAMALIAGDKDVSIRLGINVVSTEPMFQCRLSVPAQLEVDSVSLREQDSQRLCRWTLSTNLLTVFLPSRTTGDRQLLIVGRMPVSLDGSFTIPQLHLDQSSGTGFVALIYRRPEAAVEISNGAGLTNPNQPETTALVFSARRETGLPAAGAPEGRFVGVLVDPRESRPANLHIQQNDPRLNLAQVIRLDHNAEAWTATADIDLTIETGVVDSLQFDLPANWIGPFDVSPGMPHTVVEIPSEYRRQLVLRPQEPLAGKVQLRISGPLTTPTGQRPAVPNLQFAQVDRPMLFYLLPRRSDNEQLQWDLRHLAPTFKLPDELAASIPKLENYHIYRPSGQRQSATLRSVERTSQSRVVRLADVTLAWTNDDRTSGTAAFDLEPASETDCVLQMPAGSRITHARLDSAPAQLASLSANRWSVWLGDSKLPRHLEVVFEGGLAEESDGRRRFVAPTLMTSTLIDFSVERTAWTIIGPRRAGEAAVDGIAASSAALDRLRLESLVALGNSAASLIATEPPDVVADWCLPWVQRVLTSRNRLVNVLSQSTAADTARSTSKHPEPDVASLDQEFAKINHRLAIEELVAQATIDGGSAPRAFSPDLRSACFATEHSKAPYLLVAYPSEFGPSSAARPMIALALALASMLLVWINRRTSS
jgi:hypothetical protein